MNKETLQLELKQFAFGDDPGTFEGLLSAYGNVDSAREMVMPGAYTKTLKDAGGKFIMLWQHDPDQPIGMLEASDSEAGLWVKGRLNLDGNATAQRAYSDMKFLAKHGLRMGLSIGFKRIKADPRDEQGVVKLREIKLIEGSVVSYPANDQTWIESIKSDGVKSFADSFELMQARALRYMLIEAFDRSIDDVLWTDDSADAVQSKILESLTQFDAQFRALLPRMIAAWGLKSIPLPERKAGRTLSAASRERIGQTITNLQALLSEADSTPETEAAAPAPEAAAKNAEPDEHAEVALLHSVAKRLNEFSLRG